MHKRTDSGGALTTRGRVRGAMGEFRKESRTQGR
jgi:hypothetical protein